MMMFIRHIVGRCPICGLPFLDDGISDDPENWEHSWAGWPGRCWVGR